MAWREAKEKNIEKKYPLGTIITTNYEYPFTGAVDGYGSNCVTVDGHTVALSAIVEPTEKIVKSFLDSEKEISQSLINGIKLMNSFVEPEFV